MTNVNNLLFLPITSQGYHWTSGDRVTVCKHPPLDGNALRALVFPCFHVFLGSSGSFGVFLAWRERKYHVDLLLSSARIAVLADALVADPLGILK